MQYQNTASVLDIFNDIIVASNQGGVSYIIVLK